MSDARVSSGPGQPAGAVSIPVPGPGRRTIRIVVIGFIALLLLTAVFRLDYEVIDLLTEEPLRELSLEPTHPVFRALTEPFSGAVTVLFGLPFARLISWIVWTLVLTIALRTGRTCWAGRRWHGFRREFTGGVGWYFPLAFLPALLYWSGILSKTAMKKLTPVDLPAIVFVLLTVYVVWRSPAGERWRRWRAASNRFVGLLGWIVITLTLVVMTPGLDATGHRLVTGDDVYVADFHSHADQMRDAILGADAKLAIFDRQGIRISAVTEHGYRPAWNPDFPTPELQREIVRRNRYDMLLLAGREITTHILHLVVLGSEGGYDRGAYRVADSYDFERMIRDVRADGNKVIVAHWWTEMTYHKIDWHHLIDWGVDGFEISWAGDRAPRELLEAWRDAGMLLVAASDYQGYRKTLYSWNLLDRETFNPDGRPFAELDEHEVIETMFSAPDKVRPVAAETYLTSVPTVLEPPVGAWRYFRRLSITGRLSWLVYLLILWGGFELAARIRLGRPRTVNGRS